MLGWGGGAALRLAARHAAIAERQVELDAIARRADTGIGQEILAALEEVGKEGVAPATSDPTGESAEHMEQRERYERALAEYKCREEEERAAAAAEKGGEKGKKLGPRTHTTTLDAALGCVHAAHAAFEKKKRAIAGASAVGPSLARVQRDRGAYGVTESALRHADKRSAKQAGGFCRFVASVPRPVVADPVIYPDSDGESPRRGQHWMSRPHTPQTPPRPPAEAAAADHDDDDDLIGRLTTCAQV